MYCILVCLRHTYFVSKTRVFVSETRVVEPLNLGIWDEEKGGLLSGESFESTETYYAVLLF